MNKLRNIWLGIIFSVVALYLAIQQVELPQVFLAFSRANYWGVGVAIGVQLLALWAMACRWGQFFFNPPKTSNLLRTLLVAQLVNVVLPVRIGVLVRVYLVGKEAYISKVLVFGTIVAEKIFDSFVFVLLFMTVLPFVAPGWFHWFALPTSAGIFFALFPTMVVIIWRRRQVLRFFRTILKYVPWDLPASFYKRFETVLEGLSPIQSGRQIFVLWGWTLFITLLGALVNILVMKAFDIHISFIAAFFLLAVLQMGSRIPAPLGGMGVFQYLCVKALSFFAVDANLALSFGFMLHFVVFVPGALLGAFGLYKMPESLSTLTREVETKI